MKQLVRRFVGDETADHRRPKLLNLADERTHEALPMRVGRTCDADQVVAVVEALVEALVAERGAPGHLRIGKWPGAHGLGPARPVPPGRHR